MATTLEDEKSALLSEAAERPSAEDADAGSQGAGPLVRAYYRNVAAEDVCERTVEDLYGALDSHLDLARQRPQGTARVRVLTPTQDQDGWSAGGHSVMQVVTDDMPFLVDSLTMELARQDHDVRVVVHPQMDVVRDITGELKSVSGVEDGSVAVAEDTIRESWMQVEISRVSEDEDVTALEEGLQSVLHDVRVAVEDWSKMNTQATQVIEELGTDPPPLPEHEVTLGQDLVRWLANDHFTFLGYREYRLETDGDDEVLRAVHGTGLGILRFDQDMSTSFGKLPAAVKAKAHEKTLLVIAKANSRATVHRPIYLDYVGIKSFDESGEVVGERRFLGLFSSAAYTESVLRIPLLREKAKEVLKQAGFDPRSHAGKALLDTLENFPRDELFQTPIEDLAPTAVAVMHARERRQLKVFTRKDAYDRYVSALVYLPRDRYNTSVREKFAQILKDGLGGETVEFSVRMGESATANVHFVVYPHKGQGVRDVDTADLERQLAEVSRSWREDFMSAAMSEFGDDRGARLAQQYVGSFPEAYKEDFSPVIGAADLALLEPLGDQGIDLRLYPRSDELPMEGRLKVFRTGRHLSLSELLPMISSTGVEVVDERPYELEGLDRPSFIYEFGLHYREPVDGDDPERFSEALRAVWEGRNEIDHFNRLVLEADLTWRQATVLRAYAKYMRQGNSPFAQDSIEEAVVGNVEITRLLVEFFQTRFDPAAGDDPDARAERMAAVEEKVNGALDDVAILDHDRILRSYLTHIRATLRTNYFQTDADGAPHSYISLKMEPSAIPELPEPRPSYEIFVYSPRVEGVHLRFGAVARGGLRWSDRRDDFRTEVLGLVKAQMVKNTVIVPVGAKGGFFCKQLPDSGDRDAWLAEGVACYKTFISGLLDITDNLVDGETVPPDQVVRHDGDDSYLVVAADKGTATFSDIANGVANDYGFWLGDAFASGGSVGYDHKAMGITARGAWVSVQRHFRERGIDCQTEDFTAVGIGDMSGDVFGNGMLCSEHTRLVAAFDHRDIFLDPDPDPATSYAERRRLFELPRSSWQDYDTDLISEGGGVYSRSMKSIPVNAAVREALDLGDDVSRMTPAELMRAILLAPVDLLWNGGIGTYVKASDETHADAGDKANDAIRVDGRDLRVGCVGEGGNLGLTQLGRIEYAARDGRINTDFIDNSAGVDTSDHEVNIKILLDRVVAGGDLTEDGRNSLLAEMTDEVAGLVLRDNYEQNLALANAVSNAPSLLHVHEDWMRTLERRGVLNRELEALPSTRQVRRRLDREGALTVPELSVLMSYTKIVLADELLDSDLPDDPYLDIDLRGYFPEPMQDGFADQIREHQLRREIIVTQVVNDLVNGAGMTFVPRLAGETGASAAELTRANFVAREIFGSLPLRDDLKSWDNKLDAQVQTRMRIQMRTLVERASRWLVNNRRAPMDSQATVDHFREPVQELMGRLPELMSGRELDSLAARRDALVEHDVPEDLATRVAALDPAISLLGIVETATRDERDPADVARVHFALGERLGLPVLMQRIFALPREDRWQTMARAAIRDDLHAVHTQLTAKVLDATPDGELAPARIAGWEDTDAVGLDRATSTLGEICSDDTADLARLSVGLRVVRGLLPNG